MHVGTYHSNDFSASVQNRKMVTKFCQGFFLKHCQCIRLKAIMKQCIKSLKCFSKQSLQYSKTCSRTSSLGVSDTMRIFFATPICGIPVSIPTLHATPKPKKQCHLQCFANAECLSHGTYLLTSRVQSPVAVVYYNLVCEQ